MGPDPQEMLFRRELERWRGRFDMRVHVTLDRAGPEWRGNVGVVTDLISHARFDHLHTAALVCGPGVMMHFTILELMNRLGLKPERIYVSMERNMQCGSACAAIVSWGLFLSARTARCSRTIG